MNDWERKYIQKIKQCGTDEQILEVINRIYSDGFEDGYDESVQEGLNE